MQDSKSKRVRTLGSSRSALSPCKANGQARATRDDEEDEKISQLPTPKTPRHRDALSKKVPITPKHRIGLVRKLLTPRSVHTPSTPNSHYSVFEGARQLFARSADPGQIVGRTDERSKLHNLILHGIESRKGNCLYVSGPPGTGKSALVGDVCSQLGKIDGVRTVSFNCMSVRSSGEIFQNLIDELLGDEQLLDGDNCGELQAMFVTKGEEDPMYVVVLDEIDHLLSLDLDALYTLFEWSLQRSSKLIVVGIANAFDLTDRFLPRLRAKNLKPQLLSFSPYTASEIAEVITIRLRSLLPDDAMRDQVDFVPFVHPAAIQLCSKKVASQTGDLRKAFDIIRRSIDIIKHECVQKLEHEWHPQNLDMSPSKTHILDSSPSSRPQSSTTDLTALTAPRATIAHVSRISAAAFSNGTTKRLATLSLQQKVALCALISHQKASCKGMASFFKTPSKSVHAPPPTIRQLHATYSGLCRRDNGLHPLTATEFVDVISGLETLGLVTDEKKGGSFGVKIGTPRRKGKSTGGFVAEERRVICFVDERELEGCLDGPGGSLLQGLLRGDA